MCVCSSVCGRGVPEAEVNDSRVLARAPRRGTTWSARPCVQSAGQLGMCAWVWTAAERARTVRTGDASESESIEKMVSSL